MPTLNLDRYLKPPRLPRVSPVVILHVRADNDEGNPRACFVVLTGTGRTVEVIPEHSAVSGESRMRARYPWFDHNAARALNIKTAYTVTVYATPAEYRRWIRQGENLPTDAADITHDVRSIRNLAYRAERWMVVRSALVDIRRHSAEAKWRAANAAREGRVNGYAETDAAGATIYHRHAADGGDAVSQHLRRALAALERAGMVRRVAVPADAPAFFRRSVGGYHATDSTPDLY